MSKRSPSYPAHDLQAAVAYARKIYDADGRSESGKSVILKHMGFKGVSGASATALASVRQYGLVEGRGDRYKLTERALDILLAPGEERHTALREAALDPLIFREIWEKEEGRLPSDQSLRYYLEKERKFNKNSVEAVVKNLRSTIEYAELEKQGGGGRSSKTLSSAPIPQAADGLLGMVRNIDIPLQNGGSVIIPVPMTKDDYTYLKMMVDGLEKVHVRAAPPQANTPTENESQNAAG